MWGDVETIGAQEMPYYVVVQIFLPQGGGGAEKLSVVPYINVDIPTHLHSPGGTTFVAAITQLLSTLVCHAVTFVVLDLESLFFICRCIFTRYTPCSYIKVIGSRSG